MEIISRYGVPAEVITDNGPSFKGAFQDYCTRRGIKQRFITPDVPRSNGLAERAVQTVKNALRKHAASSHNALTWDVVGLPNILLGYRCTPQAATGHPPARILFALDPVLDHEQYFCRVGGIDYQELSEEEAARQLLRRAQLAAELGVEVVHNLRTAHDRDVQRFKMRRAGLYIPKLYHFRPGDHVYLMAQGQKPGGTLGIRARHEVLKVLEVRPSGVLLLQNQALQQFEKHMEHCVPCMLPNILGDTYAGLVQPPSDHPCQVCKDDRHWDLMLLCDNCDGGYHTYCLNPPLEAVPEGHWICPQCASLGVTHDVLLRKLAGYRKAEVSRPALELPSRSRIAKAQRHVDEWHGRGIIHKGRFGRVTFQGILEPKWFRIHWADGSSSDHTPHILRHLSYCDDSELPAGVPGPAPPFLLMAFRSVRRSIQRPPVTPAEFLAQIAFHMPGERPGDLVLSVMAKVAAQLRTTGAAQPPVTWSERDALDAVLDQGAIKQMVVVGGVQGDDFVRLWQDQEHVIVLINQPHPAGPPAGRCPDRAGGRPHLHLDPTDLAFAQYFEPAGGADMFYVNIDAVLLTVVLPPLLEVTRKLVCVRVPHEWRPHREGHMGFWFLELVQEQRVLWVDPLTDEGCHSAHRWLLIFGDAEEKEACTRCSLSANILQVTCQQAPRVGLGWI